MTINFSAGDDPPKSFVAEMEELFQDTADELWTVLKDIKDGKTEEVKAVNQIIKELRTAFRQAAEERNRIEELRRKGAGIVHDYALDFDAARAEIGRRLACLRDAGDG